MNLAYLVSSIERVVLTLIVQDKLYVCMVFKVEHYIFSHEASIVFSFKGQHTIYFKNINYGIYMVGGLHFKLFS